MTPSDYLDEVLFQDARLMLHNLQFLYPSTMTDLPLDPESYPGTDEYEEYLKQRRRRARHRNSDWDNAGDDD